MKKRILPILLLISPYLYILIAIIGIAHSTLNIMPELIFIHLCMVIVIFIPNVIYAFVLVAHRENSDVLLFWDMLLKVCNIPIYIMVFIAGFFTGLLGPFSIPLMLLLVIFDYLILLPSTMYGVGGLIQARREGKIMKKTAIINSILHFFFFTDVISAIIIFYKQKVNKKQT
jgi:hypothetical protein